MAGIRTQPYLPSEKVSDVAHTPVATVGRTSASPDRDTEKAVLPNTTTIGSDVPDGGVTAWLVVVGTWCTSFCSFGWLNSKCPLGTQVNARQSVIY